MAYGNDAYLFEHNFDYGTVAISIPRKMSAEDVVDLESHFDLILKQCRRQVARDAPPTNPTLWPDPTEEMTFSPQFEAVWQCVKRWDINCGATGNHVRAILDAINGATLT